MASEGDYLRWTIWKNGKPKKYLYEKVKKSDQKSEIEDQSVRWVPYGIGSEYNYIIMRQIYADKKPTGCFKIVKKTRAHIGWLGKITVEDKNDWNYYRRIAGK